MFQLDFWLHPVSPELPVDIRVPRYSVDFVKEYLDAHNVPFTVMMENLQVCKPLVERTLMSPLI